MASHFADRLCQSVKSKSTPLVVGLDPVYARLPESIRSHREMNDEFDVAAAIDAIFDFCTRTLRIVAPLVPARLPSPGSISLTASAASKPDALSATDSRGRSRPSPAPICAESSRAGSAAWTRSATRARSATEAIGGR